MLAAVILVVLLAGGLVAAEAMLKVPRPAGSAASACEPHRTPREPYLGVALSRPSSQALTAFTRASGITPSVVELYVKFGSPFRRPLLCRLTSQGALPLIQLNPRTASLARIAAGDYDRGLRRYAQQAARFGLPIALSFGHEMNGNWYDWGYEHVRPALFIRAWRHIHDVFAEAGARNVIWVWTVDREGSPKLVSPARRWWPGSAYVTWVGINGKYDTSRDTFFSVFARSVVSTAALTSKPILLTETGVGRGPRQSAQIRSLFQGLAREPQIIGMVWFDVDAAHGDWKLEGDPGADTAFRSAALHYR
jgi:hypothetical protein